MLFVILAALPGYADCTAGPGGFGWVFWGCGAVMVGAALAGAARFGIRRGWPGLVSVIAGLAFAAVWAFGTYVALLWLLASSACLD
jgi:hypothetical protein